jgi:hypothetical protein
MIKLAVLASGWHYASQFYKGISEQIIPNNLQVDFFVISHRPPENLHVIQEKDSVRNYDGNNVLYRLDKMLYNDIVSKEMLLSLGWQYIEKPNTIGDMEIFNQWSDDFDYTKYDVFLITHDDNLILSNQIFKDVFDSNFKLLKPVAESRYGQAGHQFKTTLVDNNQDWMFLDNGYSEYIPKAFTPRGSFSFYRKSLIDLLPNHKFPMHDITVTRENEVTSGNYNTIAAWNTNAGNFRNFLYQDSLVDRTRWLSNTKRVSKYCIEGERGFIHNNQSGELHYESAVKTIIHDTQLSDYTRPSFS